MALEGETVASRPMSVVRSALQTLASLVILSSWHTSAVADVTVQGSQAEPVTSASTLPSGPAAEAARLRERDQRREMVERGLKYLVGIQKDGSLGDHRPKAVTALYLLACLSSGHLLDDPVYGTSMQAAADWLLANSPQAFLGGTDAPAEDHALAAIACLELTGTDRDANRNLALYKKARAALAYALQTQDQSADAAYGGGWRPDDQTRRNDRVLTAWYLLELRGAQIRDESVLRSSVQRATEYLSASQKRTDDVRSDERGGFSVDAAGLPVRDVTGAGLLVSTLFDAAGRPEQIRLARQWLQAHPPRWQGPHFYTAQFFAVRGLYRTRTAAADDAFDAYFRKLVRILRERQEADGSFPYPAGHAQPILAMGRGYSTALAILILNVDRGFLPLDQ